MSARGLTALLLVAACLAVGCEDRKRPMMADGSLMVDPGALDFGRLAIFQQKEQTVQLINAGRGRLVILDAWVEAEDGSYQTAFTHEGPHNLIAGGECSLNVKFAPTTKGDKPATLVVRTEGSLAPLFKLPIAGFAMDKALNASTTELDFGRIEAESEKTLSFDFTNPSELPVEVAPKIIGADADEFTTQSFTLQPGETRTTTVRFAPTRVGLKRAVLAVAACQGCVDELVNLRAEALEQAVVAVPPDVEFGQVPVDRDTRNQAKVKNISTEPMTLTGMALTDDTDASFTLGQHAFPYVLQPGETHAFDLTYSPGHMGDAKGAFKVQVVSKRHPTTDFRIHAYGGTPELCVSPTWYDFGNQPVGSLNSVVVTVRNCGSTGAPLRVDKIYLTEAQAGGSNQDEFHLEALTLPKTLNAGDEAKFKLYFEPNRPGGATTTLHVEAMSNALEHQTFAFGGVAQSHLPCNLAITPGAVDFGTLPPGQGAVLGVKVANIGTDLCPVKNVVLENDGGGVFSLPGGNIEGLVVEPGNSFSLMIAFKPPPGGGSFAGALHIEQENPAQPVVLVPITANSQQSCLVATPPFLDFGQARPDCPPQPLKTRIENSCASDVQVRSIRIGAGTTDGEFVISDTPAAPLTLAPGQAMTIEVTYAAQVAGMNLSPLFIDAADIARPLMVTLLGESSSQANQTDVFTQQDGKKVDVLFVVDNTASMVEEHPRLVAAIPSFVSAAQAKGVDLHVAVTTTGIDAASTSCPGGASGGEAGRLFPADGSAPRLLTSNTADLTTKLQQNVQVGRCAFVEQGFEATRRALSSPLVDHTDDPRTSLPYDGNLGFLRTEAALAVVYVTDEDDHSPDDVDTYVRFLRTMKGMYQPQRATAFAIAPTANACSTAGGAGTRYEQMVQKTGGELLSVCSSDYSPLMQQVANKAFAPQNDFPLSQVPDTGSIVVKVDGTELNSGWSYDAAKNSITFSTTPQAGAKIQVSYRKSCQ